MPEVVSGTKASGKAWRGGETPDLAPVPGCPPSIDVDIPLPLARIRIKSRHSAEDWQKHSRCRVMASDLPPEDYDARNALSNLFYPTRHQGPKDVQRAKDVCRRCPVRADCLVAGIQDWERVGIWGGETEQERRITRRKMRGCGVGKDAPVEVAVEWALEHLYPTTPED